MSIFILDHVLVLGCYIIEYRNFESFLSYLCMTGLLFQDGFGRLLCSGGVGEEEEEEGLKRHTPPFAHFVPFSLFPNNKGQTLKKIQHPSILFDSPLFFIYLFLSLSQLFSCSKSAYFFYVAQLFFVLLSLFFSFFEFRVFIIRVGIPTEINKSRIFSSENFFLFIFLSSYFLGSIY